ncbi:MAG: hypothetical protein C6I05_02185 [Epsilonproteobacteria bacterium]|nr:hypothetical protein [Campylobacterota bacterium]
MKQTESKTTQESDVEIYIEFNKKSFRTVAKTYSYLQRLLNKKIDLITSHKGANKNIIENIKKETIWISKP